MVLYHRFRFLSTGKPIISRLFSLRDSVMVIVKLKEAMLEYWRRTGQKITYEELSARTGLASGTLQSIATRKGYLPTLANVEKMCRALEVPFHDMVEMIDDPPKPKRQPKKKRRP